MPTDVNKVLKAYWKTETRDPSGTLAGSYENQKTGTLAGPYKTGKPGP